MEGSLLATKLFIPPTRPGLVARPRLLEKVQAALNHSLTLVSAPAGFGKTTLLSEWIHHCQTPFRTSWLCLEEADNDPARFWAYLVAALRTIQPGVGETSLTLLHSPSPLPIESVLTPLVNDLAAIQVDGFLTLDDYHFINLKPIHDGSAFFLEHLPPRLHLVIATRKDPPLPLSRLRGKGTLLEIRAGDLRFSQDETAALFNRPGCPVLTPDNIRALNDRTEGWAVGIKMAMLSLQGEKDISGFIASFTDSQRHIMDYLMEEVLQKQPLEVQDFLLRTSILERLSGPLCDAVTGDTNGCDMLSRLETDNLFIMPLDASREWYRYEHLFAGLLRHRLERELGQNAAAELQKKASYWYQGNGFTEHAIDLALAARDWESAMDLISTSNSIIKYGGTATYNWLSQVPREILLNSPDLCTSYVWSLASTFRFSAASTFLDDFEKSLSYDAAMSGSNATLRAYMAGLRNDPRTEEYARQALSLLRPNDSYYRSMVLALLAINYISQCRFNDAEPLFNEAYEGYRQAGDNGNACAIQVLLATIAIDRAKLSQAIDMFRRAIDTAGPHPNSGYAHIHLSLVYYLRNELGSAEDEIQKALSSGPGFLEIEWFANVYISQVRVARGDIQGAEEALEKGERLLKTYDDSASRRATVTSYHVLISLAKEDPADVSYWLDRLSQYEDVLTASNVPPRAIIFLYQRSGEAARARLQKEFEKYRRENYDIFTLPLRAAQALASPDPDEALSFLAEALAISSPENIIRPLVEFGPPLTPLLRQAIAAGVEPEFARKLLVIIEDEERQRKIEKGEIPDSPASILSERESEVLRLMAEGLTNQQIGDKLFISHYTAKAHVRHILDKLDSRGRYQAVARARDLGIL